MRDKPWKQGLQQVYLPPAARKKQEFLQQFQQPELSSFRFLVTQGAYLRPWSWLVSVGILVFALLITQNNNPQEVWRVSALLPFAALATVTELSRSARYHMEELEMSARFSLKTLLMARLTLLGLGNLVLLAVLLPLVTGWSQLPLAQTGCMLLCPYCLTSLICLVLSRRFRGSEVVFLCAVAAAAVSGLCYLWQSAWSVLETGNHPVTLVGFTLVLLGLMIWEYGKYLFCGEELVWN